MKERPILFSAPMVRAILDGRKTQTRRLMKEPWQVKLTRAVRGDGPWRSTKVEPGVHVAEHNPNGAVSVLATNGQWLGLRPHEFEWVCNYGQPGDRLWVREAAYVAPPNFGRDDDANWKDNQGRPRVISWAANMDSDAVRCATDFGVKKTPSMFMPRWASRITLEVVAVRVERLQQISGADILAEGIAWAGDNGELVEVDQFVTLWDSINAKRAPWASNPWVWVVTFKRVQP